MMVVVSHNEIRVLVFFIRAKLVTLPLLSNSRKAMAINKPMLNTPANCINPLVRGESNSIKFEPKLL
jgi:hypothetical protein